MRDNYDFSKGVRGKFYQPDASHNFPIYLEAEVLDYFSKRAESKGVDVNRLVNDLLKRDIELIEGVK